MDFLIILLALGLLIFVAYKGHSVILFAPVAALLAVLLTEPALVAPVYIGLFMDKMVQFIRLYFPVFMLGAVFGKVIELSGFSSAIVSSVIALVGRSQAMLAIVLVCAILTYGGVSLFVVVFAVYPFAAELFRQLEIPKRLIPGTIGLGAFSFTMDSLPGTPQIQNIIPTTFFNTSTWAAPWMGLMGSVFVLVTGMMYLESRRRAALKLGEGYGLHTLNEPLKTPLGALPNPWIAMLPLVLVAVLNKVFTTWIPQVYGARYVVDLPGLKTPVTGDVSSVVAIWAVEAALLAGIATVLLFAFKPVVSRFAEGSKEAVSGALLAAMNTASEYGFGAVIAALPGFVAVTVALSGIPNPLLNEAIVVTTLAGITGSASGGMSIALAAMADTFILNAQAAGIPMEVLHRVASMAAGGMDTLPHNGAVITLLAVTGLTHRESYWDIFVVVTCLKTLAVFVVIGVYLLTGIY
ncbi:MAG: GntP family permease [Aquabacterium sp.]|uniref:GntP family permease n=1 Tax=Aquabacterium sp. TaxID=1872578 RepID=UPI00271D1642|nr:GntP family permease [Aquabacterium sp.]MDO9005573.1 GntP family permease [Aquabacterium sp.]